MIETLYFTTLALALGFKHSHDPDHLIAVSNLLRKAQSVKSAAKMSMSWAAGHMVTAAIITAILYDAKGLVHLEKFEMVVGVMLIVLGAFSIKDAFKFHSHEHTHNGVEHTHPHFHTKNENKHAHKHMLGIGIIHGLASNDELLILLTASLGVTSFGTMIAGIGIFSIGVVFGMIIFASLFSYSITRLKTIKLYRLIMLTTGMISVIYGVGMIGF